MRHIWNNPDPKITGRNNSLENRNNAKFTKLFPSSQMLILHGISSREDSWPGHIYPDSTQQKHPPQFMKIKTVHISFPSPFCMKPGHPPLWWAGVLASMCIWGRSHWAYIRDGDCTLGIIRKDNTPRSHSVFTEAWLSTGKDRFRWFMSRS